MTFPDFIAFWQQVLFLIPKNSRMKIGFYLSHEIKNTKKSHFLTFKKTSIFCCLLPNYNGSHYHVTNLLFLFKYTALYHSKVLHHLGIDVRKPVFGGVCEQHRRRPACTSAQPDQRLCYSFFWKASYVNLLQVKFQFSSYM